MKRTIITIAILMLALSGCAKRYDAMTKIESETETVIKHEGTAAISQEVPMANGLYRQNLGTDPLQPQTAAVTPVVQTTKTEWRSGSGKRMVEVVFIKRNGQSSLLEDVQTGERFFHKGDWGSSGDRFWIERK